MFQWDLLMPRPKEKEKFKVSLIGKKEVEVRPRVQKELNPIQFGLEMINPSPTNGTIKLGENLTTNGEKGRFRLKTKED